MELQTLFVLVTLLAGVSTSAAPHKRATCTRGATAVIAIASTSTVSSTATSTRSTATSTKVTTSTIKSATTSSVKAATSSEAVATTSTVQTTTSSIEVASTATSALSTSTSTNRVGLTINSESVKSFSSFTSGTKLSWYTNWATSPLSAVSGIEWVPQVWGQGNVAGIKAAAASWPSSVQYVLSFNEPDMTSSVGGSAMDAATAATQHQTWVKSLGGSYKIGAPAVARGSKTWLQNWVTACAGNCQYDFVPFHFYGNNAADLITYAKDFHSTFGKPLWITEWACQDYSSGYVCTDAEVRAFMNTAITWFRGDGADIVQRWAWFGAFPNEASGGNPNGLENTDGSINSMGTYYLSL